MPAAPAIAPSLGTIAVKTTSAPAVPSAGDAFGQVLRSVWGAASRPVVVPAPADGANGPPAPADPDPETKTLGEAAADQAAPATLTDRPVAAPTAALAGKPAHPAKDDNRAAVTRAMVAQEADPAAAKPGPSLMPAPEAVAEPAAEPSQVAVPPPVATRPPGAAPDAAGSHHPAQDAASARAGIPATGPGTGPQDTSPARAVAVAKGLNAGGTPPPGAEPIRPTEPAQSAEPAAAAEPAQAAVAANGLDTDGIPPLGVVPSRTAAPARGPDIRGRPPQAASSTATPEAEPVAQTVPIQTSAHPAAEAAAADPSQAASDPSASPAPNGLARTDGFGSGLNAPSPQLREIPGSDGQPAPTTAAPGTPSQPGPATSGSPVQPAAAAPAAPLPTAATGIISPPASTPAPPAGTDHRITLRPAEDAADPAPPAATSGPPLEQVTPAGPPPALPTPSSVTAAPQPHPASPAEQLAPALLTLTKTVGGGQQMTVRLQPADLGMVQVRIAQAASGTARIDITAENPTTLLALQRDQPQLQRTLDEAGISAAGRTITFHVAQAQAAASGPGAGHAGSQQGAASRNSPGNASADGSAAGDTDGSAAGGRGSYPARERNTYPTGRRPAEPPASAGPRTADRARSYRIGLDITA